MAPLKISKKHHRHVNNPFPSPPPSLPFINGTLTCSSPPLSNPLTFQIGQHFLLDWSPDNGGLLSICHNSQPDRPIWASAPGEAFLSAAAVHTEVEESRGSFAIKDGHVSLLCDHQSIDEIKAFHQSDIGNDFLSGFLKSGGEDDPRFPILSITGLVFSKKKNTNKARYWLVLEEKKSHQIGFHVEFGEFNSPRSCSRFQQRRRGFGCLPNPRTYLGISSDDEGEERGEEGRVEEFNRVFITYASEREERFYGFGEQFSHIEFKGRRVPILVQEQGIGRGDQPISFAANLVSYRSGGDSKTTYAPSPFYMTSKMRSIYLEGHNYSVFDLTKHDRVQIQILGNSAKGRILNGTSPAELIERFTDTIGRPPILPSWIISGAVVGMQGGTEAVRRVWNQLEDHDVPVSAFWLQDWVGRRNTIVGSQLWWNWEVDTTHYAGWQQLVNDLRTQNIRVMAYCNPCLAPTDEKPNRNKDLFEEARKLGILVKDNTGDAYMIPNTAFDVGMLDFTHPATAGWFKKILHEMVSSGVRGWMADFGEGLPIDACLFSGEDPIAAHNRYPELWAKVNREFVDEWNSTHCGKEREDSEEELVFFMRAGFRDSPRWAMLFWEGDQMVSWQANDGIKSSVTGLLSSGLSGFAFNHSDIGGYCAVDMPFMRYQRSEELLMRWMELNAFSVVFRTHEGNKPSSNCQFYSNDITLAHFARFAKVYNAWRFYRVQLVQEASRKGMPVARHLFLLYPDDEHVHRLTYEQFLVGSEILVVPVLDKGRKEVKVYFPLSDGAYWQHIWTGSIYGRPSKHRSHMQRGIEAWVEAPMGYPAVFVKCGSHVGQTFLSNLKDLNIL